MGKVSLQPVCSSGLRNKHLLFNEERPFHQASDIWRRCSPFKKTLPRHRQSLCVLVTHVCTSARSKALLIYYLLIVEAFVFEGDEKVKTNSFCPKGKQDFQFLMKNKWLCVQHFSCTVTKHCQEQKAHKQIFFLEFNSDIHQQFLPITPSASVHSHSLQISRQQLHSQSEISITSTRPPTHDIQWMKGQQRE